MHATAVLLGAAFPIALATGRTVYASVYLALAVEPGFPVVTADARFFNAVQQTDHAPGLKWVGNPR